MADWEAIKNNFENFKNKQLRKQQLTALDFIENSNAQVKVVQAGTGCGKSLISAMAGAYHNRFTYLVSSKPLQAQIISDFPEIKSMYGRNNFLCTKNPEATCEDCVSSKSNPCEFKFCDCKYEQQKRTVLSSNFRLLNYHYFLYEANFVGRFSGDTTDGSPNTMPVIVCDEADTLESIITDFIQLKIPGFLLTKFKIDLPKYRTNASEHAVVDWQDWGGELRLTIRKEISKLKRLIEKNQGNPKLLIEDTKKLKRIEGVLTQLNIFVDNVDQSWVLEAKPSINTGIKPTLIFKPTWVSEFLADWFFWRHAQKFILLSATFPPRETLSKLIGKANKNLEYCTLPSDFPVKNRPVYVLSRANLSSKTFDAEVPKAIDAVGEIINKYPNEKGLILSVSYKMAEILMKADEKGFKNDKNVENITYSCDQNNNLPLNKGVYKKNIDNDITFCNIRFNRIGSGRMITHDSKNREEVIEEFKKSKDPLILVSPSLERGLDLNGDLGRFVIFVKTPFLYLGDKLTSARLYGGGKAGQLWYTSSCLQSLIQGCGRVVRSKDDWGHAYLIDELSKKLIFSNIKILKEYYQYFLDAIEIE